MTGAPKGQLTNTTRKPDSLTFLNRAFKTSILPRRKLAAYMKFLRSRDATANPL